MKAYQIQRQISINAQVLTGLYEEYSKLRNQRKIYNAEADKLQLAGLYAKDVDESAKCLKEAEEYVQQAALFTPYIRKFAKKIKSLEVLQKALKHERACVACLEVWSQEDDQYWENFDETPVVNEQELFYALDDLAGTSGVTQIRSAKLEVG